MPSRFRDRIFNLHPKIYFFNTLFQKNKDFPSMLRSSFDYGRKRRTQCKFSAHRQGLCPCCAHRVCPIVPFRNAYAYLMARRGSQSFFLFLPSMLRSSFDYGRKRRTQCKFSAQRQGLCPCAGRHRRAEIEKNPRNPFRIPGIW